MRNQVTSRSSLLVPGFNWCLLRSTRSYSSLNYGEKLNSECKLKGRIFTSSWSETSLKPGWEWKKKEKKRNESVCPDSGYNRISTRVSFVRLAFRLLCQGFSLSIIDLRRLTVDGYIPEETLRRTCKCSFRSGEIYGVVKFPRDNVAESRWEIIETKLRASAVFKIRATYVETRILIS